MGLFSAGLGLILWFNYVGFADGLFGLHYLRFRFGLFMLFWCFLCLRLCYIVPIYGWFGVCLIVL
jgi:hypothetical protein